MPAISGGSTLASSTAHAQRKTALAAGRIETCRASQRHFKATHTPYRFDDGAGQRRWRHHMALAFKQRIVKQLPQAVQRMADGRLGQVHLQAGARDAAFA
jgi:hypothetical protein